MAAADKGYRAALEMMRAGALAEALAAFNEARRPARVGGCLGGGGRRPVFS
jgi:hypothetical protein